MGAWSDPSAEHAIPRSPPQSAQRETTPPHSSSPAPPEEEIIYEELHVSEPPSRRSRSRDRDGFIEASSPEPASQRDPVRDRRSRDQDGFIEVSSPEPASQHDPVRDRRGSLDRDSSRDRRDSQERHREEIAAIVANFEAVIAADREASRRLQREVDDLEGELRQVHKELDQLEQRAQHDRRDGEDMVEQRRQLERQLREAKQRLAELHEERRTVNLEGISLHRDRKHFSEELAFLRHMGDDEEQALEAIRRANHFLEKSYRDLEVHTEQLEQQRACLLREVANERELVRQEERQTAEMRTRLERMRREQVAAATDRREAYAREQKVRAMQGDVVPPPRPVAGGCPRDPRCAEARPWARTAAGTAVGAGGRAPFSTAASARPATQRAPVAAGPFIREGV